MPAGAPTAPKTEAKSFSKTLQAALSGNEPASVLLFSFEKKVAARLFCAPVPLIGGVAAGLALYAQPPASKTEPTATYKLLSASIKTASGGQAEVDKGLEESSEGPITPGGVTAFGLVSNLKPVEATRGVVSLLLLTPIGELTVKATLEAKPQGSSGGSCLAEGEAIGPTEEGS